MLDEVLFSLPIVSSDYLIGFKTAIEADGTLYVSPAMLSLMQSAETEKDLDNLLDNIPVVLLPEFDLNIIKNMEVRFDKSKLCCPENMETPHRMGVQPPR